MPLSLFYTMEQKSQKWPKTQIKGSCLKLKIATRKANGGKKMTPVFSENFRKIERETNVL